ncbi:glycosyltransferase [Buchananella felis]|uniref:glycosyltransferase n=1 Tax=Buchananella felis TaxID=3231492 RepID=UPI0035283B8E
MTRIGYVLKVYPRFSETFIVTEILAREAHGDDLTIFALRPTTDARFHPEIARVQAPVKWVERPLKPSELWKQLTTTLVEGGLSEAFAALLPEVADLPGDEVAQGVALAKMAREEGITHLHAHFASLAGRTAWIASRLSGIPYTVTTHAKDIYHQSVDRDWLRKVCGDAKRVIAISRFNQDYLTEVLAGTGANISLQYNALELDRFPVREQAAGEAPASEAAPAAPAAQGRALSVLAVGRLVPKKGFSDLVEAAHIARSHGVDVQVTIAGDGELRTALQAQIDQLDLGGAVKLIGPQTQAEIIAHLKRADLSVTPCVPADDGNIDGLPTVILEAMACGTPVIATAVSGLPEVVINDDTGILLAPGQPVALAQALVAVACGEIDTAPLARRARQLIERNFDSRRQAATLSAWQSATTTERTA